ncbi:MAG: hypothetical protein ISS82_02090 [Nanoarchaeota archaeon]|nr:hypothetical protein [Nanoarchaeota archaeon]
MNWVLVGLFKFDLVESLLLLEICLYHKIPFKDYSLPLFLEILLHLLYFLNYKSI